MNERIDVGVAARIGAYSDAVALPAGVRLLFTSGTPGLTRDGVLPESFAEQAELAWQHIEAMLAQASLGVGDLVRINQFLLRREDLPAYREIRTRHLGDARPASTLLFVDELIWPGMLIEIEAIAAGTG